jgi:hypothetical protein
MLRWFRTRGRLFAAAVLVSFVALGGISSASHSTECHDSECGLAQAHDPNGHRVQAPAQDAGHALHCILCHWTRSIRPSTATGHHLARPVTDEVQLHQEVLGHLSPVQAAQPPLRESSW